MHDRDIRMTDSIAHAHLEYNLVRRFLLLRLVEDVDAPAGFVRSVRHIVPPATLMLIRELLDSSDIIFAKFDLLEVLCNPGGGNRLGDDRVTADLAPGQNDLSGCSALILGYGLDLRTCDEERDVKEVVAEGRVGGDVDVLLLGVGDELLARKDGVTLDLVNSRNEVGLLDQSFEVLVCEVRYTDRADLALRELVDSLPCLSVGDRVVNVYLIRVCCGREQIRVRVLSRAKVDRPVDEIEIKVVKLKLRKSVVESSFDMLWVVLGVPELRCNEDILTLEAGNVLEGTLDAFSDLLLILVADWCENC